MGANNDDTVSNRVTRIDSAGATTSSFGDEKPITMGAAISNLGSGNGNGHAGGEGRGGGGKGWGELKGDDKGSGNNKRPSDIELRDHPVMTGGSGDGERPRIGADALFHDGRHATGGPDGSTEFYRVYRRRWFGVVVLTLLNIIVSWDWISFAPVSANAARFFNTTETAINWLSIAFLLAFPFIAPVVIYVLHWGPKPSIMTASVLILVGNWVRYAGARAPGGSGNFGVVMFGQVLTGLAQPFVLAAPARYSDLWFTNRGRVAATALMSLANPFGAAIGQLATTYMVPAPEDIPNMVLYVAIIATVCALPGFFVPAAPPTPVAPSSETPKTSVKDSMRVLATSPEFWMVFAPFAVYVGFFNSFSSLLAQIMVPYGYTQDDAGIGGAVLIAVGLVASAIASPIIDRTKGFVASLKLLVPIIALSYLVFIWMPQTHDSGGVAGPFVVFAVLGASSFSLLPVAVELLVEFTHPVSPEVTSTLGWSGGQVIGAVVIIASDALKAGPDSSPPGNMSRALILHAVIALAVAPLPLCLGLFGRADKVGLRRVTSDRLALEARASRETTA